MVYTLRFFLSSKCSLFHNSNVFGFCIIHILYTECAKIKKNNSGAKRLMWPLRLSALLRHVNSMFCTLNKDMFLKLAVQLHFRGHLGIHTWVVNYPVAVFESPKATEMSIVTAILLGTMMQRLEWVAGMRFNAKIFLTCRI